MRKWLKRSVSEKELDSIAIPEFVQVIMRKHGFRIEDDPPNDQSAFAILQDGSKWFIPRCYIETDVFRAKLEEKRRR